MAPAQGRQLEPTRHTTKSSKSFKSFKTKLFSFFRRKRVVGAGDNSEQVPPSFLLSLRDQAKVDAANRAIKERIFRQNISQGQKSKENGAPSPPNFSSKLDTQPPPDRSKEGPSKAATLRAVPEPHSIPSSRQEIVAKDVPARREDSINTELVEGSPNRATFSATASMAKSNAPPRGVYVPVPTFFAKKSARNYDEISPPLDLETQARHAIHLAKSGIRGLVILGSTGEAVHVTTAERKEIISRVKHELEKAGYPNYPLIAGTATQNIDETIEMLAAAKEAGAQWGLCLAPAYFATAVSQEGIVKWYNAVANKSPIPVMIYHYPGVSNNIAIAPSTFAKLAAHPNIVGCKLSYGAIDDHTLIANDPAIDHAHFATFTGLGQQLLPLLTVGGDGTIDALAGVFPKTVVRLYNLFREYEGEGDGSKTDGAQQAQRDETA
ncbi:hypothetical protein LTR04_003210, partial [Oleoguttula sp. CCFEE 6159]